ncbi:TIR domain-containing protein [Actinomadura sp. B10D3]|uniref:TIR domain-containing protein n=1 Tax=Actinomadura sp. B10D3 TaxID=3153557 RepID=UPI00325D7CD4
MAALLRTLGLERFLMVPDPPSGHYGAALVSCDIVGHSATSPRDQVARVAGINSIVAETINIWSPSDVVWSSGGDGGHVVFRRDTWRQSAISLLLRLRRWSADEGIPLRVVGHYGQVTHITGADDRIQFVGDGINYAGWLLTQATSGGIVATDAFRREVEVMELEPVVEFHTPRIIPNTNFKPQLLFLMSSGDTRSRWNESASRDRDSLSLAVRQHRGWDVLYFAKRIWQVNSADEEVLRALESVKPHHLRSTKDVNPFFEHLQPDELKEVLRLGQLVERRRGDLICSYDEPGDTMLVILRGQVGVYNSEGEGFDGAADPRYVEHQGDIVGELAYALSRNRTADLIALTDVALLSFNYENIRLGLASTPVGQAAAHQVSSFIHYRVLQHVSDNAPYLLGPRRSGPLSAGSGSWDYALTKLRKHCELIVIDERVLDLGVEDLPSPTSGHHGLCILVAGEVRVQDSNGAPLKGTTFPVLWVDVPKLLRLPHRTYRVQEEPVKILRIRAEGLAELDARQREALHKALPRAMFGRPGKYEFDVFLCYAEEDWKAVSQIHGRLLSKGITCWVDRERIAPGASVTESIEQGLRSSRFLLACVGRNFARSTWAQQELRAALHLDIKRRKDNSVLVLELDELEDDQNAVPLLIKDAKRVSYARAEEFDELVAHITSGVDAT